VVTARTAFLPVVCDGLCVLLEAKRLLAHTDRTVLSIATRLGFTEASNFGKFFTRHTGVTPLEFRKAGTTV
jgi:AraC-like DNA-binding protein